MAQQINTVVIGGNLTRDPELRQTPSGTSVCNMRIANNRRAKIQGEWTDKPGYFDVTVWGSQAENCTQYLSKGRGVMVFGELQWREWEDKEGNKRQAVDITAREVQFLPSRDGDGGGGGQRFTPQADVPAAQEENSYGGFGGAQDDDIPF